MSGIALFVSDGIAIPESALRMPIFFSGDLLGGGIESFRHIEWPRNGEASRVERV